MSDPRSHTTKSSAAGGVAWHAVRPIGLARALLKAGYGSRRQAEEMVSLGRVRIGDEVVTDPRQTVEPGMDLFLDGELLRRLDRRYFVLHKPLRVVCDGGTEVGRHALSEFLPEKVPGLVVAGRMDAMTTGLLLVSNDAAWNNMVTTTRGLEQEYRIQVEGELTDLELNVISAGIMMPGHGLFKPQTVRVVECMNGHTVVNMAVREGKIRQLRRMLASLRHKVQLVRKVRIGEIRLVDLSVGGYRELSGAEIESIRRLNAAAGGRPGSSGG